MVIHRSILFVSIIVALVLAGCGSTEVTRSLGVEERYAHAKSLFDDGDYLNAINEFTIITLQFQGSANAADAQYYLGECRFARGEYLLASFEYSVVKRNYPASPRVADAQFKTALAYYHMAPKSALDQQYTRRAIDEFQSFIEYYPAHEKAVEADARIKELTGRLALKVFESAQQYVKMGYFRAAVFYYDDVIENYHDTEYAPLALIGKTELLISRNKYKDARAEVGRFIERYPTNVLRGRMNDLKEKIDKELPPEPQSVGNSMHGAASVGRG
jgi:outer membrane protein assembly factor BamD